MAESIYEKLKRTMADNLASLSRTSSSAQTQFTSTNNRDVLELQDLFKQMISDRDDLFTKFDILIETKNKLYQSALSIYFAIVYFLDIKRNMKKFNMILELFNIYNSSEFSEKIYSFLQYVYNGNLSDSQTADFQDYFKSKYNSIKNVFYPDREVVLSADTNTISVYYDFISVIQKPIPVIGDRFLDLANEQVLTAITDNTWTGASTKSMVIFSSIDSAPDTIPSLGDLAFDSSRNILYEATTNGTWLNAKKEVIDSSIDSSENPEYYLLFALYYFGFETAKPEIGLNFSTIDIYTRYLTTSNINMTSILFGNADDYMHNIRDLCKSYLYIEDQRKERDSGYSNEYTLEIYEKFGGYSELVNFSTSVTKETIETIKENGTYNTLLLELINIEALLISIINSILLSAETLNDYIEKYAVFLKLPENAAASLENTISEVLPSISESVPADVDFKFIDYLSTPFSIDYWIKNILESNIPFRDNYTLIFLFLGQFLRSSLADSFIDKRFSNYALRKIVNYRNINNIEINIAPDYYVDSIPGSIKGKESSLATDHQIKVILNPNDNMISSTLKSIIPELSQIDILDISPLSNTTEVLTTVNWWSLSDIEELNKVIYLVILKSLLKNRKDFVKKIKLILSSSLIDNGLNLKDIYTRNILKKAVKDIFDSLLHPEVLFTNEEIRETEHFTDITQGSLDLINDYKLVWQTFYSSDTDLFDTMLLDGAGTLKDFLKNRIV